MADSIHGMQGAARAAAVALIVGAGGPAAAAEVVFGLGYTDFTTNAAENSTLAEVEIHGDPFTRIGEVDLSWAAAVAVHQSDDYWIGAGISGLYEFGTNRDWFIEASAMPGCYHADEEANDLGSNFEARLLLGIGRRIRPNNRLSVAFEHKSNDSTAKRNPGVNSVALRIRRSF